ncbi:hypothetical protein [Endozoicomonas sp. ALE010]|uniref:hypothetical protein n=1 Tax=Endozoicomonas sp. ALE010 TaxID=3403081 RepID=UPI003BB4E7F8
MQNRRLITSGFINKSLKEAIADIGQQFTLHEICDWYAQLVHVVLAQGSGDRE